MANLQAENNELRAKVSALKKELARVRENNRKLKAEIRAMRIDSKLQSKL